MDRRLSLVALALGCFSGLASAGFAQVAPPSGWSTAAGVGKYAPAANDAIAQATVRTSAALNVGGRAVVVPAAMRFAANAPLFAARAMFLNPYVIGAAAIAWAASKYITFENGKWILTQTSPGEFPTGMQWVHGYDNPLIPYSTAQAACASPGPKAAAYAQLGLTIEVIEYGGTYCYYTGYHNGQTYRQPGPAPYQREVPCPPGTVPVDGKCPTSTTERREIEQEEFEKRFKEDPLPDSVPPAIPGPLPVGDPIINPTPGANPKPQPLFIPQGLPQPIPNTDPQQYRQPGIRIVPAPTPAEPWRVDVQPVDRTGTDPKGETEPVTEPEGDDKTKPSETADLCAKNPDILACQKLDEVESKDLDQKEKPISITPDGGWGADNAACPAPKHLTVQGRDIPIPYDLFCTYMQGLRPIIIAMAWLSAAFILLGARESNG